MINYKKFRLPGNATLRVRSENIIATVSSKDTNCVDLYLANIVNPFHIPVAEDTTPKELMDLIWERTNYNDDEEN